MSAILPVVSAVLGATAGGPAGRAMMSHFSVMVRGSSQLFAAGPPLVERALSKKVSKEELGGAHIAVDKAGAIDNAVQSEAEAFDQIKRFLSYMPANVWEMSPRIEPADDPDRKDEALLEVIPHDRRRPYDPYQILRGVLDHDSIFELSPFYGRSRITALARVSGWVVGVMIDNPNFMGGSMDVAAAAGMTAEQVERVYKDIDAKRNATRYLHTPPLLIDKVPEISHWGNPDKG